MVAEEEVEEGVTVEAVAAAWLSLVIFSVCGCVGKTTKNGAAMSPTVVSQLSAHWPNLKKQKC